MGKWASICVALYLAARPRFPQVSTRLDDLTHLLRRGLLSHTTSCSLTFIASWLEWPCVPIQRTWVMLWAVFCQRSSKCFLQQLLDGKIGTNIRPHTADRLINFTQPHSMCFDILRHSQLDVGQRSVQLWHEVKSRTAAF